MSYQETRIEELEAEISKLQDKLDNFELDPDDFKEEYDELLDECYPPVSVAGTDWDASYVLKELDPIAYRCGLSDFVSELDITEFDEYRELEQELEEKQQELDELKDDLLVESDDFDAEDWDEEE